MEQQIKFLSDEVRSIRVPRLNTSQKEDQKDAPISLMPPPPIPPPPPPPMPAAVAGQYKRTLQPAKKQEEAPSTMASVLQELMQAKRRVMTMIT